MEPYRHILCATDLSEAGETAATRAADLSQRHGAKLTLLHVIEHFPEDEPGDKIAPENTDLTGFLTKDARDELARLAQRLDRENVEQRVVASTGAAKQGILRYAQEAGVDLIVLGGRGSHVMPGLFGSTEGGVLSAAACDVLVVHR
ncbi:MAG: universal stress protein [Sulfuricella sp.]|nr:universal stress protein [Sulfuricella sp.]